MSDIQAIGLAESALSHPEEWKQATFTTGLVFCHKGGDCWIGWYPHWTRLLSVARYSDEGHYGGAWTVGPLYPAYWKIRQAICALLEKNNG